MAGTDRTHDPSRRSVVARANDEDCDFPLQNLPFGVISRPGVPPRGGVAIGDMVLDLAAALSSGLIEGKAAEIAAKASGPTLEPLLEAGKAQSLILRHALFDLLAEDNAHAAAVRSALVSMAEVTLHLPMAVRSFSDMCASTYHIGRRRGVDENGQPICPPMFRTIPVGYDGRAGSVVASGASVRRPNGTWQRVPDKSDPEFGPEPRLDYELELGMWIAGPANPQGNPIAMCDAKNRLFGYSLVNDWSARGIQFWETMLGPFLGKSIATTVSPWIVTADALAPFRTARFDRPACDPPVPPHLDDPDDAGQGGLDIDMYAWLEAPDLAKPALLCATNFRHMYWTPGQMVAHHASNGCSLGAGDLIGSGTCSGPDHSMAACLAEALLDGPLILPNGREHRWLEDGETICLTARAKRGGFRTIGFGEARGTVTGAPDWGSLKPPLKFA